MKLLETIRVQRHGRPPGLVQLFQGDLTAMPAHEAVDVLAVSAFPNDYFPVPGGMIGALAARGLSVGVLAKDKELDLRNAFSCWLSREIQPRRPGIEARRLLCFEPFWRGSSQTPGQPRHPAEAVEELYQALIPFTTGKWQLTRVALPLLAAGDIGCTVEEMTRPLITEAIRCMQHYPLQCVKLVCLHADSAARARSVFQEIKQAHALFDVFISYSQRDSEAVSVFVNHLSQLQPDLSIFRDASVLEGGDNLDQRIRQAVRSCSFFVPFYSPNYFESDWCKDEFGMALVRNQVDGRPRLFPILLAYHPDKPLSKLLGDLLYKDCSKGKDNLHEVCKELIRLLTGA